MNGGCLDPTHKWHSWPVKAGWRRASPLFTAKFSFGPTITYSALPYLKQKDPAKKERCPAPRGYPLLSKPSKANRFPPVT